MKKRNVVFTLGLCLAWMAFATGCARFHNKPLSPAQTAAAYEARTLDNPLLKAYLEKWMGHEIKPWPPKEWDFPTLVAVALYYHPDLDVARAKWKVAEAGIITAGQRPNPTISTPEQYILNINPGENHWTLPVDFDIPIETAGKRKFRKNQAAHLAEAARRDLANAAWLVRSRLRSRLLDYYSAMQTGAILKKQHEVQQENVTLLTQRLAFGQVSFPDVTQAVIAHNQTLFSLREAEKQEALARVQLADGLGLSVGALEGGLFSFDFADAFPAAADFAKPETRRLALLSRPDLLSSLSQYAASQAALQLEIAKQYPDIHLGPGYSWDQTEHKFTLGVSVTLPLFNQNQGPIAEAVARRAQVAAEFNLLQAQVISEIDRTLAGYGAALKKIEAADLLLTSQKQRQQAMAALLKVGESARLAVLSAQLELTSIEISRLEARVQAQQSLGQLEDALRRPLTPWLPAAMLAESNLRYEETLSE